MDNITYKELVARYGASAAYQCLREIEKAARVKSPLVYVDEEERLQRAFKTMTLESVVAHNDN